MKRRRIPLLLILATFAVVACDAAIAFGPSFEGVDSGTNGDDAAASLETSVSVDAADASTTTLDAKRIDDATAFIDAPLYGSECLGGASAALPSPGAGFALVADSLTGFSDVQGRCGWTYGYTTPADPKSFTPMPNAERDEDAGVWWLKNGTYWTLVGPNWQHPNGVATCCGRESVEHWAVRRWTSNVVGSAVVVANVHKLEPYGVGGNGVRVTIVVSGNVVYEHSLGYGDKTAIILQTNVELSVGSTVDIVVDPFQSNDAADSTFIALSVWQ